MQVTAFKARLNSSLQWEGGLVEESRAICESAGRAAPQGRGQACCPPCCTQPECSLHLHQQLINALADYFPSSEKRERKSFIHLLLSVRSFEGHTCHTYCFFLPFCCSMRLCGTVISRKKSSQDVRQRHKLKFLCSCPKTEQLGKGACSRLPCTPGLLRWGCCWQHQGIRCGWPQSLKVW